MVVKVKRNGNNPQDCKNSTHPFQNKLNAVGDTVNPSGSFALHRQLVAGGCAIIHPEAYFMGVGSNIAMAPKYTSFIFYERHVIRIGHTRNKNSPPGVVVSTVLHMASRHSNIFQLGSRDFSAWQARNRSMHDVARAANSPGRQDI